MSIQHDIPMKVAEPKEPRPLMVAAPAVPHGTPKVSVLETLKVYAAIARPDHWFKNVFMALGVVLAYFCHPDAFGLALLWPIFWAVATTCLIASSNYVLNEILDAPTDRSHPIKRHRPIPSGLVRLSIAYAEWILFGAAGLPLCPPAEDPLPPPCAFLFFAGDA